MAFAVLGLAAGCGRIGFDAFLPVADSGSAPDASPDPDASSTTDASIDADLGGEPPPFTATHNGWVHVSAVGATTPKASASPLPATASVVELAWRPITITPARAIASYEVVRATTPGGPYAALGTVAAADPQPTRFTDATIAEEARYYYQVRPIVEGFSLATGESDSVLEVVTPPSNMALLHRWIANLEVCELLGQNVVDRDNNYRCDYTGPGRVGYAGDIGVPPANESYYDIGAHHFVDQFEMGCNYTLQSSGCPDDAGAPGVCLGIGDAAPDAAANEKNGNSQVGNEGDVFYDRGSGICYIKNATAWVQVDASTAQERAAMADNSPGLPPFVLIGQVDAGSVCQSQLALGASKQLLSRKLHVAAGAWPAELSEAQAEAIESGMSASGCNADRGHPDEVTFDAQVEPTDAATLPATMANTSFVLRSGDTTSSLCRSRYGVRDLAGNVWEWTSDQLVASSGGDICTGSTSAIDPTNRDLTDVVITRAAGGGANQWDMELAARFLPALGVPLEASVPSWFQSLNTTEVAHRGDRMFMVTNSNGTRGTYVGGSASSDGWAGRYTMNVSRGPNESNQRVGFRCAFRLDP